MRSILTLNGAETAAAAVEAVREAEQQAAAPSAFAGAAEFEDAVAEIQRLTGGAAEAVEQLQALHKKKETTAMKSSLEKIDQEIAAMVAKISRTARSIKEKIERLKKSNTDSLRLPGCGRGSAAERHRTAVTLALAQRLKKVVEKFTELRQQIEQNHRETIRRRVQVVTGQPLADEELDRIVESGKSDDVIRAAVEGQGQDTGVAVVLDAIQEIDARSEAIQDITREMQELQQLFMDMATLVESQGEILDQIEINMGSVYVQTAEGTKQLTAAREVQKQRHRYVLLGLLALVLLLLAAGAAVALQFMIRWT